MSARALYIGVDVHEKESQVAVYEKGGELLQEKRLPTRGLARFVSSPHGGEKHVGIESVGFIYPSYDALVKAGCDVAVANPGWIAHFPQPIANYN
jgi:transposase